MTSRLLTIAEAADVLGCSAKTVRRRIAARELPAFRDGGLVRVPEPALAAYIARRTFAADRSAAPSADLPPIAAPSVTRLSGRTLFDAPDPLAPLVRQGRT